MVNYRSELQSSLAIFKALSDESRLRIFLALHEYELCVCQIVELLKLAPSTISKHMSILNQAGLVNMRKDGRWHYYRLSSAENTQQFHQCLLERLKNDDQIAKDNKIISILGKIAPDELCIRLNNKKERQQLLQMDESNTAE